MASGGDRVTGDTVNPHVLKAEYAVRGLILQRAKAHEAALRAGEKRPFDALVKCNIGNPQALRQKPISFFRQVLALVSYPEIIDAAPPGAFPADAVARAKAFLEAVPNGTGAYSDSQGVAVVRAEVARFIDERDGNEAGSDAAASPDDVFLTDGASAAIKRLLTLVIRDERDGVLLSCPAYPLYQGSIAALGGQTVFYHMNEADGWSLDIDAVRRSLADARARGVRCRALVSVNPGNPSGAVLSEADIRALVRLCHEEGLVLFADEVYQENIYGDRPFVSVRRVARDMGLLGRVQIASFHSTSKGFIGECGRRGGYAELTGFDDGVRAQYTKLASMSLCSNLDGQLMTGLMVSPPRRGDPSFRRYSQERDAILESLKRRAVKLVAALNGLEGVSCQPASASLYVFPTITVPPGAAAAAKDEGMPPDTFYCVRLLDSTGIVVVPGSGFGQADGTFHFRSTILPGEDVMDTVIARMRDFHAKFMGEYR